jgi:hypothetical protein
MPQVVVVVVAIGMISDGDSVPAGRGSVKD